MTNMYTTIEMQRRDAVVVLEEKYRLAEKTRRDLEETTKRRDATARAKMERTAISPGHGGGD